MPSRSATASSSTGASTLHGPHQSAQKSTTTGTEADRSSTSCSKVSVVTSISGGGEHRADEPGEGPRLVPAFQHEG